MNNAMLSVKDEIVGAIPGFKYPIEETLTPKPTAAAMLATGGRHAEHWGWQGKPYSILIDLPPLSVSGFKLLGNLGVSESTVSHWCWCSPNGYFPSDCGIPSRRWLPTFLSLIKEVSVISSHAAADFGFSG